VSRVLLGLRSVLHPVSDLMTVQAGSPAADRPSIRIASERFTVALADTASITVALEDRQIGSADIVCAAAYLLTRVDQNNLAAQLAVVSAGQSSLIFDFDVAFTLARAMYRAQRIADALDMIAELNDRPGPEARRAAFVLQTAVLARGDHLTQAEARRAVDVGRLAFERANARYEPTIAAADAYNLAKALLRTGADEDAIQAFRKASELDASYLERAYYHSELAGVLFEASDYDESAYHYGRAIDLGGRPFDRALRADALLMDGRYAEAQDEFAAYLENNSAPSDAEWRLKRRALDEVRRWGGDRQDRRPKEASARAEQVSFEDPGLTIEVALDQIGEALALDACCFPAYQRLAILSIKQTSPTDFDTSRAVGPALAAAVLFRVDPDAWVGAITVAANSGESDDYLYDLMITGLRLAGYTMVDALLGADSPPRPEHVALLERAAADYESSRRPGGFVMRFPDPDAGGVVEVVFPPPGERDDAQSQPASMN
jgi:tetratricopeptide (TPR) repeat protein